MPNQISSQKGSIVNHEFFKNLSWYGTMNKNCQIVVKSVYRDVSFGIVL